MTIFYSYPYLYLKINFFLFQGLLVSRLRSLIASLPTHSSHFNVPVFSPIIPQYKDAPAYFHPGQECVGQCRCPVFVRITIFDPPIHQYKRNDSCATDQAQPFWKNSAGSNKKMLGIIGMARRADSALMSSPPTPPAEIPCTIPMMTNPEAAT